MRTQPLVCKTLTLLLALAVVAACTGVQAQPEPTPAPVATEDAIVASLDGMQALFVIYDRFSENEYGIPRRILEGGGATITVGSATTEALMGHAGNLVEPDILLAGASGSDYDAVIFVGGAGYEPTDPEAQRIAREAIASGKVVAAICVAPTTLALAGLVKGKRVTGTGPGALVRAGGIFTGAHVERDGLLITGSGPLASREFGEVIAATMATVMQQ